MREYRRRQRLDRTDHAAAAAAEADRRRREQPPEDRIEEAIETVAEHDIPGTPPVWALKVLEHVYTPTEAGDRRLLTFDIARGRPRNGALRSDDHISHYKVEYPRECGECGHDTAVYEERAHHHIAGGHGIECAACGAVHESNEWG